MPVATIASVPLTRAFLPGMPPLFSRLQPFQARQPLLLSSNVATRSVYVACAANDIDGKRFVYTFAADLAAGSEIDVSLPGVLAAADNSLDAEVRTDVAATPPTLPANVLRVVARYITANACLDRRGSDVADGAMATTANGQFRVKTSSAGANVVRVRGKTGGYKAGEQIAFSVLAATDITQVSGGALAANRIYETTSCDFVYAGLDSDNAEVVNLLGRQTP